MQVFRRTGVDKFTIALWCGMKLYLDWHYSIAVFRERKPHVNLQPVIINCMPMFNSVIHKKIAWQYATFLAVFIYFRCLFPASLFSLPSFPPSLFAVLFCVVFSLCWPTQPKASQAASQQGFLKESLRNPGQLASEGLLLSPTSLKSAFPYLFLAVFLSPSFLFTPYFRRLQFRRLFRRLYFRRLAFRHLYFRRILS